MNVENALLSCLRHFTFDDPISGDSLSSMLDVEISTINRAIRRLRKKGNPIGSNNFGYFWCRSPNEINWIIKRIDSQIVTLKTTKKYLQKVKECLEY